MRRWRSSVWVGFGRLLCATGTFQRLGLPFHEAQTLELLDRREEALAIYERIGDVRDGRRLGAATAGVNRRGARHQRT